MQTQKMIEDLGMNMLHRAQFFPKMIDYLKLKTGLEVGVKRGMFSNVLLTRSNLSLLVSVDIWEDSKDYEIAEKRLSAHGERSRMIKTSSVEATNLFEDGYFDFIYIDANHDYEHVLQDMKVWWPKLRENGMFSGHDYMNHKTAYQTFGVIKAVDEFAKSHGIIVSTCEPKWRSWFLFKKQKN